MKSRSLAYFSVYPASRPTRGAWIEIDMMQKLNGDAIVAPHTGRVD